MSSRKKEIAMSKELAENAENKETPEEVKPEEAKEVSSEEVKAEEQKQEETPAEEKKPEPEAKETEEEKPEESDDDSDDLTDEEFEERAQEKDLKGLRKELQQLRKTRNEAVAEVEKLRSELDTVKNDWQREKNTASIVEEFNLTPLQMEFVTGSTLEEMKASAQKYLDSLPIPQKNVKLLNGSGTAPKSTKDMTKAELQAAILKRRN